MKENLYTFSKDGWFVKTFQWIYGINPVERFKSFCPLFWVSLLTILFIPLILVVKLFGKAGTKLLNDIHESKERRHENNRNKFIDDCRKIQTSKQAYNLANSICWDKYSYYLPDNLYNSVKNLSREYSSILKQNKQIRKEKIDKLGKNKILQNIGGVIFGMVLTIVVYYLYMLCNYTYHKVDWKQLFVAILYVLVASGVVLILRYFVMFLYDKLSHIECGFSEWKVWSYIGGFFSAINTGCKIFVDMIKNFYHNNCPIIHWVD